MRKISSENFAFYYKGGMSYATFKTIFPPIELCETEGP